MMETEVPVWDESSITNYLQSNPHAFMPGEVFGGNQFDREMTSYQVQEKDLSFAMFYPKAVPDVLESKAQRRPVFRQMAYITIMQPGETSLKIDRPVKQEDVERFPDQWQRYLSRVKNQAMGTPLEALFPYHPEIVLTLKASNVLTVEALAGLSDAAASALGFGSGEMKERARRYLVAVSNPEGAKMAERDLEHEKTKAQLVQTSDLLQQTQRRLEAVEAQMAALKTGQSVGPVGLIPGSTGQALAPGVHSQPLGDEIPESDWDGGAQAAAPTTEKRGPGRPRK